MDEDQFVKVLERFIDACVEARLLTGVQQTAFQDALRRELDESRAALIEALNSNKVV